MLPKSFIYAFLCSLFRIVRLESEQYKIQVTSRIEIAKCLIRASDDSIQHIDLIFLQEKEMSLRKIKRRLSHTFRLTVDGSLSELAEQLTIDEESNRTYLNLSDSGSDSRENGKPCYLTQCLIVCL